ncbi:MAG: alpha/beta fold hydrolase [Bacteroidota bacterium]
MHIVVNGANLLVDQSGNAAGMPVVFIHGFPFSHAMWDAQVQAAGRFFRTVAYDIRGHGMSDVGDGQYTIEGHVDDLFALLTALDIDRPVIVGLSMGGYIALRALERDQTRFCAAVLCDTRSEADSNEAKLKRFAAAGEVKRSGSEAFAKEFTGVVFAPGAEDRIPEAVQKIRSIIAHTPPLSIAGTQLALASRTDTTAALPSFNLPVLILVGEHDRTTPVTAAEAMHAQIPGSQLFVVPRAAHMSNLENPEFFNARLMRFLEEVNQRSARGA